MDTQTAASIIADALADAKAPCMTSSFQAEDVVVVHLLRLRPEALVVARGEPLPLDQAGMRAGA